MSNFHFNSFINQPRTIYLFKLGNRNKKKHLSCFLYFFFIKHFLSLSIYCGLGKLYYLKLKYGNRNTNCMDSYVRGILFSIIKYDSLNRQLPYHLFVFTFWFLNFNFFFLTTQTYGNL